MLVLHVVPCSGRTREMLEAGDEVKFLDQCFEDEEYKELSHGE